MKKQVFSKSMAWILSVVMMLAMFVIVPVASVEAYTSHSRDEAVAWAKSKIGSKIDVDGAYGAQCVDLIMAYYQYLGVSRVSGNGCDYSHNSLPSGWTRIQNTASFVPNPGDIVVWTDEGWKNGHVAIFLSGNTSNFTSIDQNWPQGSEVKEVYHSSYKYVWGVIRPDFTSNPAPNTFHGLSKVDRGTNFYGLIIRNENWAHLADVNGNVEVKNDGNIVWYFTKTSDGGYKIKNVATGKYLDVNGAYDKDDNNVQTWEPNDSAAQVWYIYGPWSGEYVFKPKCTSDKVLNVYGPTGDATTWTFNPDDKDMRFALWDDISTYTVSYNMNGGSGSIGNQTKVQYSPLTLSGTKPTRTGYEFVGWNTSASATTAQYQPGGKYTANSGATLYAIWKANTYTVSYNMNGGSGSISNQTKTYGQDLTLSSTKPTRTGYDFVGWNTSASATTAQYQPGGKYTANSGATLYAIWKINTWTVSYNMNGGSGSIGNQTKTYGQDLTLSSTKPTRTGYTFVGWNTSASATTAQYQPGGKYTANSGATLYAIWKINTWTVSYNMNGGSGSIGNQTKTYGQDLTLSSTKPTRTGYEFVGWNTNKDATSAQYAAGGKYTANSGATLYAIWKAKQVKVTFYRNLNSDDTTTASQTFTYGASGQSFSNKNWTKDGYTLLGWSSDRNATTASYSVLSTVSNDWIKDNAPSKNLYAVWKETGHSMSESEGAGKTIPDGDYYIISELNQDYFIDLPGDDFDTASGTNVQMWIWDWETSMPPKEGYDCFHIEYLNNGFYKISQINTNKYFDVDGPSLYLGANVHMWSKHDGISQQWSIEKTSHGYRIRSRYNSYCLDIADGKHEKGRNIRCWKANDARCQSFSFIPRKLDEKPISDGVYTIKTNVNKTSFLDVYGSPGEFKAGSNVQLYNFTNAFVAEKFTIKYASDGWYKILEKTSGLALELVDPTTNFLNNSKNVKLAEDNGNKNQLWKIRKNTDGTYFVINKANGYYLDLESSKTDNGANVSTHEYNGGNNQKWIIELETYAIKYNMNGGSGSIEDQIKTYGIDLTLSSKIPTRDGYTFVGWNSHANATTAEFQPNWKYVNNYGIVLYAIWKINAPTDKPVISNLKDTYSEGSNLTFTWNKVDRATSYGVAIWRNPGGESTKIVDTSVTTTSYTLNNMIPAKYGIYIYAKNESGSISSDLYNFYVPFTIKYDLNGGTGTIDPTYKKMDVACNLSSTKPTRPGYIFVGWNTDKNATTALFQPGAEYRVNGNVTLYAIWKENPLINSSTLSATALKLGATLTVTASATGGTGDYTYAVYFKKSTSTSWTKAQDFSTNSTVKIKPAKAVKYDVLVKVKDSSGKIEEKTFTVNVFEALKNTSTVVSENIGFGDTVTIKAKSTGGLGECTYAVYYKKSSAEKWSTLQKYSDNTTVTFKPASATTYDVMVKVKDSRDVIVKKTFTVNVTKPENTSIIAATEIKLGNTINISCSATGSSGFYQYAVLYKKASSEKWTTSQNYSPNNNVTIKPASRTTYNVCVKVKDNFGNIAKKYFDVTVK